MLKVLKAFIIFSVWNNFIELSDYFSRILLKEFTNRTTFAYFMCFLETLSLFKVFGIKIPMFALQNTIKIISGQESLTNFLFFIECHLLLRDNEIHSLRLFFYDYLFFVVVIFLSISALKLLLFPLFLCNVFLKSSRHVKTFALGQCDIISAMEICKCKNILLSVILTYASKT